MWLRQRLARYLLYGRAELSAMNELLAIPSDLRLAIRSLSRSPGFVLIAVITVVLALALVLVPQLLRRRRR